MTTLHGEQALVGDIVYDCARGPGKIKAVSKNCLHVQFNGCNVLKYSCDGFTGKNKKPTLFWQPLPTELMKLLAKSTCKADLQLQVIRTNVKLMDELICADCPEENPYDCCEEEVPECCPSDPCEPSPLKILKSW